MLSENFYIVQDGDPVSSVVNNRFNKYFKNGDVKYKKISFVGFIIDDDKLLVSFPKYFLGKNDKNSFLSKEKKLYRNMKLLFDVITTASKNKSEIGVDIKEDLNDGYPFSSFYQIYDYFKKYHLYSVSNTVLTVGGGKINWKNTLSNSSTILTQSGLLFTPLINNKKQIDYNFVSKCMAYAINHTLMVFKTFIDLPKADFDTRGIDWTNREFIVNQLKKELEKTFKDEQKKLILNLIEFYSNNKTSGKKIIIKFKKFDLVWEEILKYYLEYYLLGINDLDYLEFSSNKNRNNLNLDDKQKFQIESDVNGRNSRRIEPDYYFVFGNVRYLLDSKYYDKMDKLDYKQIAYYFLLKTEPSARTSFYGLKKTVNVLMLPTNREVSHEDNFITHLNLNTEKYNYFEEKFQVLEQYFNLKHLMRKYVK